MSCPGPGWLWGFTICGGCVCGFLYVCWFREGCIRCELHFCTHSIGTVEDIQWCQVESQKIKTKKYLLNSLKVRTTIFLNYIYLNETLWLIWMKLKKANGIIKHLYLQNKFSDRFVYTLKKNYPFFLYFLHKKILFRSIILINISFDLLIYGTSWSKFIRQCCQFFVKIIMVFENTSKKICWLKFRRKSNLLSKSTLHKFIDIEHHFRVTSALNCPFFVFFWIFL